MKSKGPVDFFLGVFLEFGAAFCLLFFLPQVPWQWLPGENGVSSPTATPLVGDTASQRRVLLRPVQPTFSSSRLSQTPRQPRQAPPLLQPELEPAAASPAIAPLSANAASRPQPPAFRRDFPRQYRY